MTLHSRLAPTARRLDGNSDKMSEDEAFITLGAIAESDIGLPSFYTDCEAKNAELNLRKYLDRAGSYDSGFFSCVPPPPRDALIGKIMHEPFSSVRGRYGALTHRLTSILQESVPQGEVLLSFAPPSDPTRGIPRLVVVGKPTPGRPGRDLLGNYPIDEFADGLYQSLPEAQGQALPVDGKLHRTVDYAAGRLYIRSYRILPGNRMFPSGVVVVPDAMVRDYFRGKLSGLSPQR